MELELKLKKTTPPRKFKVGLDKSIELFDCCKIFLNENEQVTFVTSNGKEHDFVAKSWGFYATPSVNGRLKNFNLKTALIKNSFNQFFIVVVDPIHIEKFNEYLKVEKQIVVEWLDEREDS